MGRMSDAFEAAVKAEMGERDPWLKTQAAVAAFNERQTQYRAMAELFDCGHQIGIGVEDVTTGAIHAMRTKRADMKPNTCLEALAAMFKQPEDGR